MIIAVSLYSTGQYMRGYLDGKKKTMENIENIISEQVNAIAQSSETINREQSWK